MKKIVFGVIILALGLGGGYWYLRDGYMGHGPGSQKNENSDGEGGGATSDEKHGKAKKAPKPVPVTVATLVPGLLFLAVPFTEALRLFTAT